MPIFEYKCQKCQRTFEQLVNSTESEVSCPQCGSRQLERQFSEFAAAVHDGGKRSCSVSECASCCPSGTCGLG